MTEWGGLFWTAEGCVTGWEIRYFLSFIVKNAGSVFYHIGQKIIGKVFISQILNVCSSEMKYNS